MTRAWGTETATNLSRSELAAIAWRFSGARDVDRANSLSGRRRCNGGAHIFRNSVSTHHSSEDASRRGENVSVDTITFVKEALSLLFGSRAKDLNANSAPSPLMLRRASIRAHLSSRVTYVYHGERRLAIPSPDPSSSRRSRTGDTVAWEDTRPLRHANDSFSRRRLNAFSGETHCE